MSTAISLAGVLDLQAAHDASLGDDAVAGLTEVPGGHFTATEPGTAAADAPLDMLDASA